MIGSRAYNLEREDSDWDRRSVYVLPTEQLLGLQEPTLSAKQGESMELIQFCRLATSGSPNQIEYLYSKHAKAKCVRGDMLLKNRHWFLSKKMVPKYIGFLTGQLTRYREDVKARVQAFRLAVTCRDLLKNGELSIDMTPYLGIVESIRNDEFMGDLQDDLLKEIRELEQTSELPAEPNYEAINNMILFIRRLP